MPRYEVSLYKVAHATKPDIVQVVRAVNTDEAVEVLMKARDMSYASSAKVVGVDNQNQPTSQEEWRWRIRCKISGEFSAT
jgi:hypothetical protein